MCGFLVASRKGHWSRFFRKKPVVQIAISEALWGETETSDEMQCPSTDVFTDFARSIEPALRYALVAELGYHQGREAAQDALVFAWEHWDRLETVENRGGYLYRVAKRRALRHRFVPTPTRVEPPHFDPPAAEPGLRAALRHLSGKQRAVVFLVEGLGMTYLETADFLDISRSSVQTHLERALGRLRKDLGVRDAV